MMSDNKNNGRSVYGKGYYIALILCAAAISIAGFFYYQNGDRTQPVLQEAEPQATVSADVPREDLPVVATEPQQMQATEVPAAQPEKKVWTTAAPVSGQEVAEYAMDCLSYNETTRDWRVHNGVDLAAPAGTEVMAAADGVVYTTYTDDMMGTTVVIRHDGGYTTQYASLGEELKVSVGDQVTVGQVIGCVGETALIETNLGPHVHFSVLCNDESVDPADFLALGNS